MKLSDYCEIDFATVLEMPGGPEILIILSDLVMKRRLSVWMRLDQAREFANQLLKTADDLESKKLMKDLPSVRFVF